MIHRSIISRITLKRNVQPLRLVRGFFDFPSPFNQTSNVITHKVVKKINVPPKLIFEIVSDVSKYKEFVPFVEESFINKRDSNNLPVEAGLRIGWKQFDEKFICKLKCEQDKQVIAESLTTLLFNSLYTEWNFQEVNNHTDQSSSQIELILKYNFKSSLYNTISSMFSEQVSKIMIQAFEERAIKLKLERKFKDRQINFNQD